MILNKNISADEAIEIAKKIKNMPQAIHEKIIYNFKLEGKVGILSFISLESPVVEEITIDGIDYFQITFLKGDLSWQQLSNDFQSVEMYLDGRIADDLFAKCLVNKKNGKFKYIGTCDISPHK